MQKEPPENNVPAQQGLSMVCRSGTIDRIHTNDVLMGRGKRSYNYEGNIRFRDMVRGKAAEYHASNVRSFRRYITDGIIARVHDSGGRFLKPGENMSGGWEFVPVDIARKKVRQALGHAFALSKERLPTKGDERESQPSGILRSASGGYLLDQPLQALPVATAHMKADHFAKYSEFNNNQHRPGHDAVHSAVSQITANEFSSQGHREIQPGYTAAMELNQMRDAVPGQHQHFYVNNESRQSSLAPFAAGASSLNLSPEDGLRPGELPFPRSLPVQQPPLNPVLPSITQSVQSQQHLVNLLQMEAMKRRIVQHDLTMPNIMPLPNTSLLTAPQRTYRAQLQSEHHQRAQQSAREAQLLSGYHQIAQLGLTGDTHWPGMYPMERRVHTSHQEANVAPSLLPPYPTMTQHPNLSTQGLATSLSSNELGGGVSLQPQAHLSTNHTTTSTTPTPPQHLDDNQLYRPLQEYIDTELSLTSSSDSFDDMDWIPFMD